MTDNFPPVHQCPLRYRAIYQPDQVALLLDQQPVSFAVLDAWVSQCQDYYLGRGLEDGDHLAVVTTDPLHTFIMGFACLRSGWVFCPINPAFPESKIKSYCDRINARLLVSDSGVNIDIVQCSFNQLQKQISLDSGRIMNLVATSGTTGTPKAVAHRYTNHYVNAKGSLNSLPLKPGDSWLLSLPLFHVGGFAIIVRCLLSGATMVCYRHKRSLRQLLQQYSVTHLSLVNTQLFRLLEQGCNLYELGIRHILLGGGIASPLLVNKARQQGVNLLTTYGLTEMASQVCTGEPVFTSEGVTSGQVLPGRELTLSKNNEILVQGETLAAGYYDHGRLINLRDEQGWYHTGDIGHWVNDQIHICGRMDNMLISGGENIHPEEIEQALLSLEIIVQAVVVAVKHSEFDQRPVAYVQTADNTLNESDIKKRLADRVPGFMIPDRIWLFPEEDMSNGIKPDRRAFQQLAVKRQLI